MRPLALTGVLLPAAILVAGCADNSTTARYGDCSMRVRYAGVVYRGHNAVKTPPNPGAPLGMAETLRCDDTKLSTTTVSRVRHVDPRIALHVGKDHDEVYVAEGLSEQDFPEELR